MHGTDKAPNFLLANNFVYGVDLNFKLAMGWIYGYGYGCVCINYEDVYFFMNGYFVNGGTNSLDDQNGTNYHSHSDIRDFFFSYR